MRVWTTRGGEKESTKRVLKMRWGCSIPWNDWWITQKENETPVVRKERRQAMFGANKHHTHETSLHHSTCCSNTGMYRTSADTHYVEPGLMLHAWSVISKVIRATRSQRSRKRRRRTRNIHCDCVAWRWFTALFLLLSWWSHDPLRKTLFTARTNCKRCSVCSSLTPFRSILLYLQET